MKSVILMGRWSEDSAVIGCHVVFGAVWLRAKVMSGEEGCWFSAVGCRVGVFVLIVM